MINNIREEIEWLNYWIQDANNREKRRILLLGDSVARGYRKMMDMMVQKENSVVDLLATSYSILDDSLIEELRHFVDTIGYCYQSIVFQMGFHHGYWIKCKENQEDYDAYYRHLENVLNILRKLGCNIITVSATPENTNYQDANNEELRVRSNILKCISEKYGYVFVDLYSALYNNKEFRMIDIVHYADKGYEYIAYRISKVLGFQCERIESNRIYEVELLSDILENDCYIYGDGKKGKLLYEYLCLLNIPVKEQFIVSDEYYQQENKKQISLGNAKDNLKENDTILVTIEDNRLWDRLKKMGLRYYTLEAGVYIFIDGYVNGYRKL